MPDEIVLLNNTAWLLATSPDASLRNGVEAVGYARRAAQLTRGQEPVILGTLAAAYAEEGQFSDAVETAHGREPCHTTDARAVDLAAQQNRRTLAESIAAKIPLYQAGTPYHEPPASPAAIRP